MASYHVTRWHEEDVFAVKKGSSHILHTRAMMSLGREEKELPAERDCISESWPLLGMGAEPMW